jgi:hypothetical protein
MSLLPALLAVFVACGGASAPPAVGTPGTPPPAASASWTELRVAWDFGPCPDDGRSCHQSIAVKPDGSFVAAETPNAAGSGGSGAVVKRSAALDARETAELHRIVDAAGFVDRVGAFGCGPDPDANVGLEIDVGGSTRKEDIGGCVHSSATPSNAPSALAQLVELLAPHRSASHDAPTPRPPPTGEGDACSSDQGCGAGLVCVIAPCVVAPCTNGTCHKASP